MTSHHIQVHLKRTTKHLHIYLQSQIKLRLNERGESGVLTPVHWYVSQTRMRATKYAPNVSSADASTLVCLSHGSQCCHHVSFRPPRLHASWRSDGSSCRGGPHQLWVGLVNCSRWIGGPDPSKKNHTCIYRKKKICTTTYLIIPEFAIFLHENLTIPNKNMHLDSTTNWISLENGGYMQCTPRTHKL